MAAYVADNNNDYRQIRHNTVKLGEFKNTLDSILDRLQKLEQVTGVVNTPSGGRRKFRKTGGKKKKKRKTRRKRK